MREIQDDDQQDVWDIVRERGLPMAWEWPRDARGEWCHGTVAEFSDGHVVAFMAVSETVYGLVANEFWCRESREGLLGLGSLARWFEALAQRLADERGESVDAGGVCRLDNPAHLNALKHRGYVPVAEVLHKTFEPRVFA